MFPKIRCTGYFILILLAFSCKKNSRNITNAHVDVYVTGTTNYNGLQVAAYWKNGVATILNHSSSSGVGIAIIGNDVYVSGNRTTINNLPVAAYWKNGVETDLADSNTTSFAQNITNIGNDIYIVGITVVSDTITATVWKNGVATLLPKGAGFSQAGGVINSNNNVYITGINNMDINSDHYLGVYWKNNVETVLPNGNYNVTVAAGIASDGTTTYIAGIGAIVTENQGSITSISYPVYWKNGVLSTLTIPPGYPTGVAEGAWLSGSNIYIAGTSINSAGVHTATIWKNGIPSILADNSSNSSSANSFSTTITVHDNNIYVVGQDRAGSPAYWKNGNLVELPQEAGNANLANGLVVVDN